MRLKFSKISTAQNPKIYTQLKTIENFQNANLKTNIPQPPIEKLYTHSKTIHPTHNRRITTAVDFPTQTPIKNTHQNPTKNRTSTRKPSIRPENEPAQRDPHKTP